MGVSDWIGRRCSVMAAPAELVVERDGRTVAVLDDPRLDDMFWWKWRMTAVAENLPPEADLYSDRFWHDSQLDRTVFRCRASGPVADMAIWAGWEPVREGRLVLRRAYVPVTLRFRDNPFLWIKLLVAGGGAYDVAASAG